jgi:hypothetical protein
VNGLDPLRVGRVDVERYARWLPEVRCYQPSTVSRRLSVVVGFYRVCVIDQVLSYSPVDYVRRPPVPAESPTLGVGHLQFEALITTARRQHRRPRRGTLPPRAEGPRQGRQDGADPAAAGGGSGDRSGRRRPRPRADLAQ